MKALFFSILIFGFTSANAYHISSAVYNSTERTVAVTLAFQGGEQEHQFTASFDLCDTNTQPMGLAVRLLDSGWEDPGTQNLTQTVHVDVSQQNCFPAELTIFAGRSRATVNIY